MASIDIRSLAGVGWEPLAAAFTAAFADYAVPMAMTAASLEAMQTRRGYAAAASFGAFDGAQLVGFALTCTDGDRAYNSGTGVLPAHRRGQLARRLLDAVIAHVPDRPYVLEVIETNAPAVALYRSAGFVETRRLQSWVYARRDAEIGPLVELDAPDLDAIAADSDVAPSWQNSVASLRRAPQWEVVANPYGAAIVYPASGDLPLLCVRHAARRRGHGARLLAAAAARSTRPLRIINVDERGAGIAAFLEAVGATRLVRQIELIRDPR